MIDRIDKVERPGAPDDVAAARKSRYGGHENVTGDRHAVQAADVETFCVAIDCVVGEHEPGFIVPVIQTHAGIAADDGVVHELEILRRRTLVRLRVETVAGTVEDDVIADDGIGSRLDTGRAAVPQDVAFDDVLRITRRAVDDDARPVRVVYDVVANNIGVRAELDLDAVALQGAQRIVNPVVFDQRIGDRAAIVVATDIHAFAGIVGSIDVVLAHRDVLHAASEVYADGNIVNHQVFERNVRGVAVQVNPVAGNAIAGDLQSPDRQVMRAFDIDRVLQGRAAQSRDVRTLFAAGAPDDYGLLRSAGHRDADAPRVRVGALVDRQRIARVQVLDGYFEAVAGEDVEVGGGGRQGESGREQADDRRAGDAKLSGVFVHGITKVA